jgi:hypothetical protein
MFFLAARGAVGDGRMVGLVAGLEAESGVKTRLSKPHDFLVRGPTQRAKQHREVDRLEQARLALAVGAEEDRALGPCFQRGVLQVPETPDCELLKPHY